MKPVPSSTDERRNMARARIREETLPLPNRKLAPVLREPLKHIAEPINCAVCLQHMHPGDMPCSLVGVPGELQVHSHLCFEAWLAAARDELDERGASLTFDKFFQFADQTREALLLWAHAPTPSYRVEFRMGRSMLANMLGSTLSIALEFTQEQRLHIEAVCRRAYALNPRDEIELVAQDFI